ncbi:MAG: hypothetical protein R2743_07245 [Ilumatobacteraceae bacterium]
MNSLDDLSARLDSIARDLSGPGLRDIATEVGVQAKRDIEDNVRADVGSDRKFSGWPRRTLNSGFELEGDSTIVLRPRPIQPWRVANDGRRSGPIPRRKNAVVTVRTPYGPKTVKGTNPIYNGRTRPMHTWDDSVDDIVARTPERVLDAFHERTKAWLAKS